MEQKDIPHTTTESIPAADIRFEASDQGALMTRTFAMKQPDTEKDDFIVGVRATTLKRCRRRFRALGEQHFPWGDLLLSISTAAAGASAGALASGIKLDSQLGLFFYILLLPVATGSFVAYIFLRRNPARDVSEIAQELLAELPDPDKAV